MYLYIGIIILIKEYKDVINKEPGITVKICHQTLC